MSGVRATTGAWPVLPTHRPWNGCNTWRDHNGGERVRYIVYGAGAVGGTIGWCLSEAGRDVTLIARGEHLAAIRRDGLDVERVEGGGVRQVPAVGHPEEIEFSADDVVLLTMKTQHTLDAVDALASIAPPTINVVCAQNGVENERIALRAFDHVYAVCVMLPADHMEPGRIRAFGTPRPGILDIGRYPSGSDEVADQIATDLRDSGFASEASPVIMRMKYRKLCINLHNGLEAVGGEQARTSHLADAARQEAETVLARAGIETASAEEDLERRSGIMSAKPVPGGFRGGGSSWQSLARGTGSIETDYMNGEIALLGRQIGVPTPVNSGIQALARACVRDGVPAGSLSVAEIESSLGLEGG